MTNISRIESARRIAGIRRIVIRQELRVEFVIAPPLVPTAAIAGTDARFPVHRIYCIGRNYADHAKEMGMPVERGTPMFFCKPADALVADGATIAYPQATQDLHHEVEMVVAL